MKDVVETIKKSQVALKDMTGRKFYGVLLGDGSRSFIVRQDFEEGNFRVPFCSDEFTNGNSFCTYESDNLRETARLAIKDDCEVKEFDSAKEMFAWLAGE